MTDKTASAPTSPDMPAAGGHVHGPGCAHDHDSLDPNALLGRQPLVRTAPKVGRNDPCPCGSGKKHKKCCGA